VSTAPDPVAIQSEEKALYFRQTQKINWLN